MMRRQAALAMTCALLTGTPVLADSATNNGLVDLQTVTCEQYLRAVAYADPGASPTKDAQALADEAQDDLVLAMMWVNGYLTGRDGAKGSNTFDQDWVVAYMGKLTGICKASDSRMPLREAAEKL